MTPTTPTTTKAPKLWRVIIRVAPQLGTRNGLDYEYHVLAADTQYAKAQALAEWGYGGTPRIEHVVHVRAEGAGLVAPCGLSRYRRATAYRTPRVPKAGVIPSQALIDHARETLEAAEQGLPPVYDDDNE